MGKPNKLPAHAEYAKDFLMKDSPAIKYNPKIDQIKQAAPAFSLGKNQRFFEQSTLTG